MRIVVIHGSPRTQGNSYAAAQRVLAEMRRHGPVECTEFNAAKEFPELCRGCGSCVLHGEQTCPHAAHAQPMFEAMLAADALIFTTPVYVMAESAAIKNFLEHYCYLFMVHRARPEMFRKKALILCTTLGGGARRAIGTVRQSLLFWGINHIATLALPMHLMQWEKIPAPRRAKLERKLQKVAAAFYTEIQSGRRHGVHPMLRVMHLFIGRMMRKSGEYGADSLDKQYWQQHGWLEHSPFSQATHSSSN